MALITITREHRKEQLIEQMEVAFESVHFEVRDV
jgi:hypothetical protein